MGRHKIKFKSKDDWTLDKKKKYLWIHNSLPIQVMVFENQDEVDIKCLWVKTTYKGNYVSNYFVYTLQNTKVHPLDYAIEMVGKFKDSEKKKNDDPIST